MSHEQQIEDALAEDLVSEAHTDCVECGADGCTGCPSAFCELPRLIEHEREWMHEGCIAAFDRHIANRCTGDVCNCPSDGVPVATDEPETTPVRFMTDAEMLAEHRALRSAGGAL